MFDPFGDFAVAGYLRNVAAEQDLEIVKAAEHELFRAQLPAALDHLARRRHIEYADSLEVHRIIFGGLYPWAGKDRAEVLPDRAVTMGSVFLCHPRDCRRAVQEGLSQAQDKHQMAARPGFIMGMFPHGQLAGTAAVFSRLALPFTQIVLRVRGPVAQRQPSAKGL